MIAAATADDRAGGVGPGSRSVLTVVAAGVVLFVVYVALSFVNAPDGTLSTDVGGKVATLRVMESEGSTAPEVGYWAREWDATGADHGLYYTSLVGDHYVNVTSVPVMELARPLYAWAGYRAALLWSMVGAVATAFAARALAARSGADRRRSWLAFWLTGLASPVLLYALDLWEHAPGLGLMAWGVVAMVDAAGGRRRWVALGAGLAFGAAFSMRTEAAVYGMVVVGVGCLLLWRRRSFLAATVAGGLAAIGFVVMALANYGLEVAVLGASRRAGRSSGAAGSGGSELAIRLREAVTTTVGLFPDTATRPLVIGAIAVGLLAWAAWRSARGKAARPAQLAVLGAVLLFLLRAVDGLGFVPGFAAAAPFAVVGSVLAFDRRVRGPGRDAVLMVVVALPVVWLFQYTGGAVPQWGGRYVLTTAIVAGAVGIGASGLLEVWLQRALVGLSVGVAVFGLAWMSFRTHEVARAAHTVADIDVPVVSAQDFWLRELGAVYEPDSQWLSVTGLRQVPEATAILDEAGERQFVLLWAPPAPDAMPPDLPGWQADGTGSREDWLGVDWRLTSYSRT